MTVENGILFDAIITEVVNNSYLRDSDQFGFFDAMRSAHPNDISYRRPTWRQLSAFSLLPSSGVFYDHSNTVAELQRLNHFFDSDSEIGVSYGAIYVWYQQDIPDPGDCCCCEPDAPVVEAPLRLAQRNDGLGPFAHPRLRASVDASTSVQSGVAPRLSPSRYR